MGCIYSLALIDAREGQGARADARLTDALAEADHFIRDFPGIAFQGIGWRAMILAKQGRRAEARAALAEMERASGQRAGLGLGGNHARRAAVLGVLGDIEAGVAELRTLHEAGYVFGYTLRLNADYEPLRAHAKFQQLMKECEARADAVPRPKK